MKNLLFLAAIALMVASCTKEDASIESIDRLQTAKVDERQSPSISCDNDYWLCHATTSPVRPFVAICISDTSYFGLDDPEDDGHVAHVNDVLLDADGDGFTAENPCGAGSQDDCDDTNPDIGPGAVEICDDEIDNDCDGLVDAADPDCA